MRSLAQGALGSYVLYLVDLLYKQGLPFWILQKVSPAQGDSP